MVSRPALLALGYGLGIVSAPWVIAGGGLVGAWLFERNIRHEGLSDWRGTWQGANHAAGQRGLWLERD